MIIEQIAVGGMRNLSYLVTDNIGGSAVVIDPAYRVNRIIKKIEELKVKVKYILITHGHEDHLNGYLAIKELTGAQVVMFKTSPGDVGVDENDELIFGSLKLKVIYTPGHTNDSVCYLIEDSLFTGDLIFVGKIGGSGLGKEALAQYESLQKIKLMPKETKIYPGHDFSDKTSTTIGEEIEKNHFLKQKTVGEFVDLKMNWSAYKKKHGIW
jgi:hydroxyacylglutathione hydrolase